MIHLLKEHSLTSIGTVRKNKTSVPEIFKKGTEVNSSRFGFQNNITLVSYVPKKNKVVLVMSTLHHDQNIDEYNMMFLLIYQRNWNYVRFSCVKKLKYLNLYVFEENLGSLLGE